MIIKEFNYFIFRYKTEGLFMSDLKDFVKVQKRILTVCARSDKDAKDLALDRAGNFNFNEIGCQTTYWKEYFWNLHLEKLNEQKELKCASAVTNEEMLEVYEVTVLRADYHHDAEYFIESIVLLGVCASADIFRTSEDKVQLKKCFESLATKKVLEESLSNCKTKSENIRVRKGMKSTVSSTVDYAEKSNVVEETGAKKKKILRI